MFQQLIQTISQGWVGSIIGIIGICIALVTYFRSRQRAIPTFQYRGLKLLGHTVGLLPDSIEVFYKGVRIPRLTKTIFIFWNAGEKTISGNDIVKNDPLSVEIPDDCQLLSASVIKRSREVVGFDIVFPEGHANSLNITFDYLDPQDGAVIEILHTSSDPYLSLLGTIRGVPSGLKDNGRVIGGRRLMHIAPFKILLSSRKLYFATVGLGLLITLLGYFAPKKLHSTDKIPLIAAGLLYAGLGLIGLWMARRKYPRALHCEALE